MKMSLENRAKEVKEYVYKKKVNGSIRPSAEFYNKNKKLRLMKSLFREPGTGKWGEIGPWEVGKHNIEAVSRLN